MVQLQISKETLLRMKSIIGKNTVSDGDYLVNEVIDTLEKRALKNS